MQRDSLRQTSLPSPRLALYVVAISHLDSQWRWTIQDTIRSFIPTTLRENFFRFERFPHYVLSFEGAFRYMLAEEYYPEEFETLRGFVARDRWRLAGTMLDAPDVNVPSPESLIRHVLYANRYFRRVFDRTSVDLFLPDCFGFSHALPSIAAHCGLKGFSSSKLVKWRTPAKIPFHFGLWEGPDGARIPAALEPGGYGEEITEDLSRSPTWIERLEKMAKQSDLGVGYKYFGVGDRGGAPDEESLRWLERSLEGDTAIRVIHSGSDQIFRDLTPADAERLPVFRGELLLPTHGTGCWTSQAALKRWNRRNELLGDAAERAALLAEWLGGPSYPSSSLRRAWIRFLWHQMHDDLTGTSIPEAYRFTCNDQLLSLNQFATILTDSIGSVSRVMDTRVEGIAILVFNPLSIIRQDPVEARIVWDGAPPPHLRVTDPEGREVASQVLAREGSEVSLLFLATVPAVGLTVYDVRAADHPSALATGLSADRGMLENDHYRVRIDENGDIASVVSKRLGRELLSKPATLDLLPDRSPKWPAWEILYRDVSATSRPVRGPAKTEILETGPARVALQIVRRAAGSVLSQTVRLAAGSSGERIEVATSIDWHTRGKLLKATFPLTSGNPEATYDLGLGVIRRAGNKRERYEVPAQEWADLSAADGSFGISILNDCKYGWDKPADDTLRLTLLRSPRTFRRFRHQATQDLGEHRFTYAIHAHRGDWSEGETPWQAARLNQPLMAFQTESHRGALGSSFAFLEMDQERIAVRSLKRVEDSGDWLIRLQETTGSEAPVAIKAGAGFLEAREVDGCEQFLSDATTVGDRLHSRLGPFQPRSFTVTPQSAPVSTPPIDTACLSLSWNASATSFHSQKEGPNFDSKGNSLPGELLPNRIQSGEIAFQLGPAEPGAENSVLCAGQEIELPAHNFDRLYLIATAASRRDVEAVFRVGTRWQTLRLHSYTGPIGQRRTRGRFRTRGSDLMVRTPVAWVGTHRHDSQIRDQPYVFCYLFRYVLRVGSDATSLLLPDDSRVRIFAATLARLGAGEIRPAQILYD
jgi:alpha-mannosidase